MKGKDLPINYFLHRQKQSVYNKAHIPQIARINLFHFFFLVYCAYQPRALLDKHFILVL